jgi:transcriptional regulator with XRE-family HTH domain
MEFGRWLKDSRSSKHWDLKKLAEISGVDIATISRLENGLSEVTVNKAVKLCRGLEISLQRMLSALMEIEIQLSVAKNIDPQNVLNLNDVIAFIHYFEEDPLAAGGLLCDLMNAVNNYYSSKQGNKSSFVLANIVQFLNPPEPAIFKFPYPTDFRFNRLREIFKKGGVLTFQDAGHYIRNLREREKSTIADIGDSTYQSASLISRLESGNIERIKLSDIIALDSRFAPNYELLEIYWQSADHYLSMSQDKTIFLAHSEISIDTYKLALLLITVSRWVDHYTDGNVIWLHDLRHKLLA